MSDLKTKWSIWFGFLINITIWGYFIFVLNTSIIYGVDALDEISARTSLLKDLEAKITASTGKVTELLSKGNNADNTSDISVAEVSFFKYKIIENEIMKERVTSLILRGANTYEETLLGIMHGKQKGSSVNWFKNMVYYEIVRYSSSGLLIGYLMINAAGLGSFIYCVRNKEKGKNWDPSFVVTNIVSGLGAGIACYLIVQGDGVQYMANVQSTALSPQTKVLFGFVAGLYSGQVYDLLTRLVDSFVDKFPKSDKSKQVSQVPETPELEEVTKAPVEEEVTQTPEEQPNSGELPVKVQS